MEREIKSRKVAQMAMIVICKQHENVGFDMGNDHQKVYKYSYVGGIGGKS
jgi:hypothetical protein